MCLPEMFPMLLSRFSLPPAFSNWLVDSSLNGHLSLINGFKLHKPHSDFQWTKWLHALHTRGASLPPPCFHKPFPLPAVYPPFSHWACYEESHSENASRRSCLVPLGRPRTFLDALFSDIASILHCLFSCLSSASQCIAVGLALPHPSL